MANWLGITAEYDPPRNIHEGFCKPEGDAFNNATTHDEKSKTSKHLQECINLGFYQYDMERAKAQDKIDLAVMGGSALAALVVLVLVAMQWGRISARFRQARIDHAAASQLRAKDKQKDKADFARQVQERLTELEKQREV